MEVIVPLSFIDYHVGLVVMISAMLTKTQLCDSGSVVM